MREHLQNLLISEVVVVSGAKMATLKQWIDTGLITAPPLAGKHRRFSAQNTLEVILMTELNGLGIKPSAVANWLRTLSYPLLDYIDEHAIEENGTIRMTKECVLVFWVTERGCISVGTNIDDADMACDLRELPQHSLVFRFSAVICSALSRALRLSKEADAGA